MASFSILNLALNVAGFLYNNKPVAIYANGGEILRLSSVLSCRVTDTARLMEHPVESGAIITDHKVFQPKRFVVTVALSEMNYSTEYAELYSVYKRGEMVTLQTKAQIYENLQIESIPHEEKVDTMCRLIFNIGLKEAQTVAASYIEGASTGGVASATNSNTVSRGAVKKGSSYLNDWIGGWL